MTEPRWISHIRALITCNVSGSAGRLDKQRADAVEAEVEKAVESTQAGKPFVAIYDDPVARYETEVEESNQELTPKESARLRELRRARDAAGRAW